ncbi:protein SHORT HYPOCOTYL IN WHITE LIGHT 1 [Vigna radiata var. radiata]|uniref:Protein SHORT HYPOCOTYL IN WHITE LIGHT 1 n=1 Tax=Vigna radiata var. radiata TaxID=3916 RepID=A0A1S3T9T7_VIGRR|nr:protein SHORT HYPOCOTYL IN WHITE LIGHT 1 [Vigna radiata var. radiata]XP_022633164.1 protein SHORT HYPOCOTYL IN WHITE LIGHT 1 [Vigna radiata var. radiata]
MAGATATTPPLINLTHSSKPRHFSANNIPFSYQRFYFGFYLNHSLKPITTKCHSKLNSSGGGEPYEMDETGLFDEYDGIEDDSDDEDAESSVDLLIRFFQSMFKKVSKRAKKASRSVLPTVISPQLVSFAVDGTLLLASLSVVKALLEVMCTLGGTVFAAILVLRVIWAAVSYFQSSGNSFNQGGNSFGAVA